MIVLGDYALAWLGKNAADAIKAASKAEVFMVNSMVRCC
jgi:hypothetical protein